MGTVPYRYNLTIPAATDWTQSFQYLDDNRQPIDTTSYTGTAELKRAWHSANSVPFTVSFSSGTITLSLDANSTANVAPGFYVYSVEVFDSSNNHTRPFEGVATLTPRI